MNVGELIKELQRYPADYRVQYDAWPGDEEGQGYIAGEITGVTTAGDVSGHGLAVEIS